MAEPTDFITRIAAELVHFVEPLAIAAKNDRARRVLFGALGWDLDRLTGFPALKFVTDAAAITTKATAMAAASAKLPTDFDEVGSLLDDIGDLFRAVQDLSRLARDPGLGVPEGAKDALANLGGELLQILGYEYLSRHQPLALHAMRLLTLARARRRRGLDGTGQRVAGAAAPALVRPTASPAARTTAATAHRSR